MKTEQVKGSDYTVITYCTLPYNGRGPTQSCVSLLEAFPQNLVRSKLYLPRARRSVPQAVELHEALPKILRRLPWRAVSRLGTYALNRKFSAAIETADPANTIAYFWPDPPLALIRRAKQRGILTVREMINSHRGTAKTILDEAYKEVGLVPSHGITALSIKREREELRLYDYVFASTQVEPSLAEAGVIAERILPGGFGWSAGRWKRQADRAKTPGLKALFVGTLGVRKGVPQLLAAWRRSKVVGELVLVGAIDKVIAPLVSEFEGRNSIRVLNFTDDIASLYNNADVFIFPTFEEGGPQVTYEAAALGLPVITTQMGAGRIIKHEENGLIVQAGDVEGLTDAILRIALSEPLRKRLGVQAAMDAANFTYAKLGRERIEHLVEVMKRRDPIGTTAETVGSEGCIFDPPSFV